MSLPQSFSIAELEALSGFDRRTIAFYIQEGVLAKVGRRGSRTRYPRESLDRLKLVQRIRDLQDAGKLPDVTLADIGLALESQQPERIRALAEPDVAEEAVVGLFEPGGKLGVDLQELDFHSPDMLGLSPTSVVKSEPADMAAASTRRTAMMDRIEPNYTISDDMASEDEPASPDIRDALRELDERAALSREATGITSSETLTRVPITGNVMLSVRGLVSREDRAFAEYVAELLGRYMK
jgi:DNA-binding transcriptional MerR regulator